MIIKDKENRFDLFKKKISITQPTFFPYPGYFSQFFYCDEIVFLDDVQFSKNSWQKKNKIKSSNGMLYLSLSTKTKNKFFQKINEVEINYTEKLKKKLINAIYFNYSRSKHFKQYFEELKHLLQKDYSKLIDINISLIKFFFKHLEIKKRIIFSSELNTTKKSFFLIKEIYEKLNADLLISTIGVKSYFPLDLPKGFNVKYFEYNDIEYPYNQLFGKFISNLSILDLILNCGKDTRKIILKNTNYDF